MTRPAVFLDRDGTINADMDCIHRPDRLVLLPGVIAGLRMLAQYYPLIVVTNQSGIGRGQYTEEIYRAVMNRLRGCLTEEGVRLTADYFCPHTPDAVLPEYRQHCECRKPNHGMLLRAAADHDIDLARSWMIGDSIRDIEAGRRGGCRTISVGPEPYGADYHVQNIVHAAEWIRTLL